MVIKNIDNVENVIFDSNSYSKQEYENWKFNNKSIVKDLKNTLNEIIEDNETYRWMLKSNTKYGFTNIDLTDKSNEGYILMTKDNLVEGLLTVSASRLVLTRFNNTLIAIYKTYQTIKVCEIKTMNENEFNNVIEKLKNAPLNNIMEYVNNLNNVTLK